MSVRRVGHRDAPLSAGRRDTELTAARLSEQPRDQQRHPGEQRSVRRIDQPTYETTVEALPYVATIDDSSGEVWIDLTAG